MKRIEDWIQKHLVPIVKKISDNFWFSIVADAVLYIVPFSMVSAIPSLWSIVRKFLPSLPDITPISTYSFGLIGLFVVFVIPFNALEKLGRKDRATIAGFTGMGTFLLCMHMVQNPQTGLAQININNLGAPGMFTAIVIGLLVAIIYKLMAKFSFFKDDSPLPDFVKNWFDNIIAIVVCLFIGWLLVDECNLNIFALVTLLMKPVTGFAQSIWGVITITLLQNVFYFFGVSGWVFTPVTRTITQAAIAENAAALTAGRKMTNIYSFGFSRYTMIGGQACTLPLALMMLFSKSRKNKVLGKATILPSLFNINEPLFYGTVVNNPFMFIPVVLISIVTSGLSWIIMHFGFASINHVMFDMSFAPNVVSAYVMSGGDWRNVILVCVNFIIAALIWYPFFKVSDKFELEKEQKLAKDNE